MNTEVTVNPRWNKRRTESLIKEHFGHSQAVLAWQSIRSVDARQQHAKYHYSEVRQLLRSAIDDKVDAGKSLYAVTWFEMDDGNGFMDALMKSRRT